MSFQRYPEYKDSGVEWLGEVPAHWEVKRLSHYFDERREKASDVEFAPLSVTKHGVVPRLETAAKTQDGDNRKKVCAGDFVINSRSDRKGSSGLSSTDGTVSLIYIVLEPKGVNSGFVHHLLRSVPFQEEFYRYGKGIVADLWSTGYSEMKNIVISLPSDDEQKHIATFLDHETARIDALVEEQKRLIELLKEKRQAVISHAVTKGLDPDVPMKDSGVEWLGEVPAHWDLKSLMHLTPPDRKIMYGIVLPGPDFDGGVPIIKGGDVKPGRLSLEKLCRTDPQIEARYERSRVASGDIVYSIRGGIGDVEIVPEEIAGSNLTQDAARVSPKGGVCNAWLLYALKSGPVFAQLEAKATGATIRGINIMDLKRATLPVPPSQEQQEIAESLSFIIGKLDRLEQEAGAAITLMQEHRSALISAAVTGKIDVRGWQPPTGSTASTEAIQAEVV